MPNPLFSAEALEERIKTLVPELTEARHDIHQHPELGFEETRTQAKVKAYLEALGYAPCVSAETGLVADVRPDLGAPRLALRADIDCLPMQEDTDLPYKSIHNGRAHKCGHDGHTSDGGAVLSVCTFHSGTAHNVIPSQAQFGGTIRTFSEAVNDRVLSRLEEVVRGTAAALGVEAQIEIRRGYPLLVNDPGCAEAVARVAERIVGPQQVTDANLPMAGGEDFAYMAQAIPGAYFFLGTGNKELTTPVCHHPDFDFDDTIIPLGVRMFVGLVEDRLS